MQAKGSDDGGGGTAQRSGGGVGERSEVVIHSLSWDGVAECANRGLCITYVSDVILDSEDNGIGVLRYCGIEVLRYCGLKY